MSDKNYNNTKCNFKDPSLKPTTILFSLGYSLLLGIVAMITIFIISVFTGSASLAGIGSLAVFYFYYDFLFSYVISKYESQCSNNRKF